MWKDEFKEEFDESVREIERGIPRISRRGLSPPVWKDIIFKVVGVPGSTGAHRPKPTGTARRTMGFYALDEYLSLPGLEAALLSVTRR